MHDMAEMLSHQFFAALKTLRSCVERCPASQWHESHGDHPFSQVVFHTIFYADYYLGKDVWPFKNQPFHAAHRDEFATYEELEDVLPVQQHGQHFCLEYLDHVEQKMRRVLANEDMAILAGESGISFRNMGRAELHLYNIRHIQHHAAQLGLRLQLLDGVELTWVTGQLPFPRS